MAAQALHADHPSYHAAYQEAGLPHYDSMTARIGSAKHRKALGKLTAGKFPGMGREEHEQAARHHYAAVKQHEAAKNYVAANHASAAGYAHDLAAQHLGSSRDWMFLGKSMHDEEEELLLKSTAARILAGAVLATLLGKSAASGCPECGSEMDGDACKSCGYMAKGGEHWIADATRNKGGLHRALGVPEGEKIPEEKIEAAANRKGRLGKQARLARTLSHLHH